jgi:cytochrome c peroxidase
MAVDTRPTLRQRLRSAGLALALASIVVAAGSLLIGVFPFAAATAFAEVAPGPAVSLAPASLTFADQIIFTKSAAQTVTLTNSGNAPLNITAIALGGPNPGDFSRAGTCTAPLTIEAGGSCTIDVTFAPLDGVPVNAAVQITDDAAGTPHSVALSGTGVDPPLLPLSTVPLNLPQNLGDFVRDRGAAVQLGKALFWDMQAGSDGVTACATCHFNAGTDSRPRNQLNPGKLATGQPNVFAAPSGPNYDLTAADFPFHQLANPDDRDSAVVRDTTQVMGSQGVVPSSFLGIELGNPLDLQDFAAPGVDATFNVNGINTRRPTGRNTPSVINAVFNFRNFWDGRAQNDFNGVNPFGSRDANAKVLEADASGNVSFVRVSLKNSSLASQAVGPPGNDVEMSAHGRDLRHIGKKLLSLQPLERQLVDSTDSVLSSLSNSPERGLHTTYAALVQQAFAPKWWSSNQIVTDTPSGPAIGPNPGGELAQNQFTQMQQNFSLFWGLSVGLYMSTLVSDQSPLDHFLAGNTAALTAQQQQGLAIFQGKGFCQNCHGGPELSNASVSRVENEKLENMIMGNGQLATYDNGFYNIGVRQTGEDVGLGGNDPFGKPLSMTKRAQAGDPEACGSTPCNPGPASQRAAVNGSFKVPLLRNVALTAPYFHNGGQLTLRQVVEFYNRGADFSRANQDDFDVDIGPIGLTETEKQALVAFLRGLTDTRVADQSAPFDHPQLFVPNGHEFVEGHHRFDDMRVISATGAAGGTPLALFPAVPGIPYVSNLQVTCSTPAPSFSLYQGGNTRVSATVLDQASAPPPRTISAPIDTGRVGSSTIDLTGSDLAGHAETATCPYEVTPTLFGDERVLGKVDYNAAGLAEAFRTAPADLTGSLGKITLYLDAGSEATQLVVGVYSHDPLTGKPGALLATGRTTAPLAGAWNTISVSSSSIEAGKRYWIALLSPVGAGTVRFRDDYCCNTLSGPAETSLQTNLSELPPTWSTGKRFKDAPLSAFASRP